MTTTEVSFRINRQGKTGEGMETVPVPYEEEGDQLQQTGQGWGQSAPYRGSFPGTSEDTNETEKVKKIKQGAEEKKTEAINKKYFVNTGLQGRAKTTKFQNDSWQPFTPMDYYNRQLD